MCRRISHVCFRSLVVAVGMSLARADIPKQNRRFVSARDDLVVQCRGDVLGDAMKRLPARIRRAAARNVEVIGKRARSGGQQHCGGQQALNHVRLSGKLVFIYGGRRTEDNSAATAVALTRSEEHTSELQSLMRISYAVFCLKKKKRINIKNTL